MAVIKRGALGGGEGWVAMAAAAAICGMLSTAAAQAPVALDLHWVLGDAGEKAAILLNEQLSGMCPGNQVNLTAPAQPHITMYLSEFAGDDGTLAALKGAVGVAAPVLAACEVTMNKTVDASGTYALWGATGQCLQVTSDYLSALLAPHALPNQTLPGWVSGLPPAEAALKTAMFNAFASPNVFLAFQGHVTVGWDSSSSDDWQKCVSSLDVPELTYVVSELSLGPTGPHGTVLRGQDLATWTVGAQR